MYVEQSMSSSANVGTDMHTYIVTMRPYCSVCPPQSHKPSGVLHMMQCHHISDAKQKGVQLSYAVAIEIEGSVHYLKMESASSYNEWIKVRASSAGCSEETHFGAHLTYCPECK